jgi:hypothetical protein
MRNWSVENIIKGKDGESMSAKILGPDFELNLWQPSGMRKQPQHWLVGYFALCFHKFALCFHR